MWSPSLEVNFFRAVSTSSRRAGGLYSTLSTDSRDTMLKISSEQEKSGDSRMVCKLLSKQGRQAVTLFHPTNRTPVLTVPIAVLIFVKHILPWHI